MDPQEELNRLLAQAQVSKIVYALVMPETEAVVDIVLDGEDSAAGTQLAARGREQFHDMFREAWTQKQDAAHEVFFDTWRQWTSPIVRFGQATFEFQYPTSGASEAIREAIYAHGVASRRDGRRPVIHVFEGEYEGFAAYAAAAGIETRTHLRSAWQRAIEKLGPGEQFYLSQPSAIDGMIWDDYDEFMDRLQAGAAAVQVMLDLTYVGCVSREFIVRADYPNIEVVFFSLSKPAGTYYHRIGGMLSRREYAGLFGNKWFKNLTSLKIGTEFMSRYGVYELPRKYRSIQTSVVDQVNQQLGLSLVPSDVSLLATSAAPVNPSELESFLLRGSADQQRVRVCLTPRMAHAIDPRLTPSVAPRYYERIAPDASK